MPKPLKPRARLAIPTPKGFQEVELKNDDEEAILTHCPETGESLENIDPRKQIKRLWPTYDPGKYFNPDAVARIELLEAEAQRREAANA